MLENQLETPTTTASSAAQCHSAAATMEESIAYMDDYDMDSSACSTPYVSAPSSPGRPISGFYYSAPASPMHFMAAAAPTVTKKTSSSHSELCPTSSFEFDFSGSKASQNDSSSGGSMSSADELFLNGQIRPMRLSSHLQRPQNLAPLLGIDEAPDDEPEDTSRGRDYKMRDRSLRRRTRSMSPLRTSAPFGWHEDFEAGENTEDVKENGKEECGAGEEDKTTPCESGASSRSSSVGRSSSRWVFLKEFLYRSKSEGRNNGHKFWGSLTFSPVKDRKIKMEKFMPAKFTSATGFSREKKDSSEKVEFPAPESAPAKKKAVNGVGKRRVPRSPHELHYTANRAQAEELRRKTFLPYRQGLLGCLGFSSKSYGAMNGFARALNPVSSR